MHLTRTFAASAALALSTLAAHAGGLVTDMGVAPVVVTTASGGMAADDWTGAYGGLSFGGSDITATVKPAGDLELPGDGESVGFFAGYNHQVGNVVLGAEFDFDSTDYVVGRDILGSADAVRVNATARLKGRIGTPIGNGLVYGVAGVVGASTNSVVGALDNFAVKDGVGYLVGAGYDHRVSTNLLVGGEVLYHEFDDDVLNVEVTTFRLRVGYRF